MNYPTEKILTPLDVCVLVRNLVAGYIEISNCYAEGAPYEPYTPRRVDLTTFPEEKVEFFLRTIYAAIGDDVNAETWFNGNCTLFPFRNEYRELMSLPRAFVDHTFAFTRDMMQRVGENIWLGYAEDETQ